MASPVPLLLALLLAAAALMGEDSAISHPQPGFSFSPPTSAEPATGATVMAFLPAKHAFSANVSVVVQHYASTFDDYDALNLVQFAKLKLTVLSHVAKADCLAYEYQGIMKDRELHFYARALKRGDSVYLITATALDGDWAVDKQELIRSVDTFSLIPPKPQAP